MEELEIVNAQRALLRVREPLSCLVSWPSVFLIHATYVVAFYQSGRASIFDDIPSHVVKRVELSELRTPWPSTTNDLMNWSQQGRGTGRNEAVGPLRKSSSRGSLNKLPQVQWQSEKSSQQTAHQDMLGVRPVVFFSVDEDITVAFVEYFSGVVVVVLCHCRLKAVQVRPRNRLALVNIACQSC